MPALNRGRFAAGLRLALLGVVVALAGCAGRAAPEGSTPPQAAVDPVPPYTLERFREERKLPAGVQRLVLDNPYGDIQLRQTSAAALAIEGVEQRIGEAPRIARIEWQEGDIESAVRVRYPGIDPDAPADRRKGRVDLYAFVPAGVPVQLRSDFGEIVVRRIDNPVTARSRSGRITVAAHGVMDVESQTGELRIYPMSARGIGVNRLRSAGGIVVDIHLQPPLQLEAAGALGVRADFPLDALAQGADGIWRASRVLPGEPARGLRRFEIESFGNEVLLQGLHTDADP
ncbi:MAG: hypothetical protein MUE46_17675 [Xanthomonadales bacterium]|nr:hypothetical protein [Xanthomonadales bacterium]